MNKPLGVMAAGLILVGIGYGLGSDANPPTTKTVHHTETVEKEVEVPGPTETVTVEVLPEECLTALDLSLELTHAAVRLDITSTEVLDLISDARQAVLLSDMQELNRIETELRRIGQNTLGAVTIISDNLAAYKVAYDICKEKSP